MPGCACVIGPKETILKNKCNSNLTNLGCYNIPSKDYLQISAWKQSKFLCKREDPSFSFFFAPNTCSSTEVNFKSCGAGNLKVCRALDEECPLTSLQ